MNSCSLSYVRDCPMTLCGVSSLSVSGEGMRVALAILCVGGVMFLLRVLAALVKEWMSFPPQAVRIHFAKFNPFRRRRVLIEMKPEQNRQASPRSGERKAI